MAVTRETLLKIAAIINDEATDEATRAAAQMRLEDAYKKYPELFRPDTAPPTAPAKKAPSFSDVEASDDDVANDPEYLSFFDMKDWGQSSRNPDNHVHTLFDDTLVTIWVSRKRQGYWGWSILWRGQGAADFSSRAFPSEIAAMRNAWAAIAAQRKGGRS
jgi:hypothetical protein